MVINIEATIRWKGYNPNDLTPKSDKRVWANCNNCGKGRWLRYNNYRDLCASCSKKGKHHSDEHKRKIGAASKGRIHSDETRKKISDGNKGRIHSDETRKKISKTLISKPSGKNHPRYDQHHSKESLKKMSVAQTGKIVSEETRKKMSVAQTGKLAGEKHPFYGKHHSEKARKKISDGNTGIIRSEEARKKLSATRQGISYDEWECFAKEQPYCPAFNQACRESNREKYGRKCFICGLLESENRTKSGKLWRLSVHHIDMNKQQGCDGNKWKLIPTCIHHHGIIHNDLWRYRIIYLLNTCWK